MYNSLKISNFNLKIEKISSFFFFLFKLLFIKNNNKLLKIFKK